MGQWMRQINVFIICLFIFFVGKNASAVEPPRPVLPGSVQPGVISQYVTPKTNYTPKAAPKVLSPEEQAASFGPQAEQIKFTLKKIILEGNHVYSNAQLEALYRDKINKTISIAELQDIVQSITNYYRNNGYILSRAILPPQHVNNGLVRIQIIEGYISKVTVLGKAHGARQILVAYGNKIVASRPLQMKVMEHYLLLANQLPGVDVKAILEPSKTETGASDFF